jgi:hypothetical protein
MAFPSVGRAAGAWSGLGTSRQQADLETRLSRLTVLVTVKRDRHLD